MNPDPGYSTLLQVLVKHLPKSYIKFTISYIPDTYK